MEAWCAEGDCSLGGMNGGMEGGLRVRGPWES